MASEILVNIGSGKDFVPSGTKALPEDQQGPVISTQGQFEIHQQSITKISLKLVHLKFNSNLPRASELNLNKKVSIA